MRSLLHVGLLVCCKVLLSNTTDSTVISVLHVMATQVPRTIRVASWLAQLFRLTF